VILIPEQVQRDGAPTTNNTVVVGQQMNMTNVISGGFATNAVTSYHWGIPGANNTTNDTAFYDYEPNATNSCYTNLFTPTNYTTNNYCNFYWSSGGTNQVVYCTNVIYGQTNVVSATLNVQRPVAGIIATTGTTVIDTTNPRLPFLRFGLIYGDGTPGMTFSQTNTPAPGGFTGNFLWNQIINTNSVTWIAPPSLSSGYGSYGYDGARRWEYPYTTNADAHDSPGSALLSFNTNIVRNFTATMYLMWQASTNSTGGDKTVAIPLRSYQWNWAAAATNGIAGTNVAWGVQSATNYTSGPNIDTTNEPIWSTNEFYNKPSF